MDAGEAGEARAGDASPGANHPWRRDRVVSSALRSEIAAARERGIPGLARHPLHRTLFKPVQRSCAVTEP